jgi:hypothetical protein
MKYSGPILGLSWHAPKDSEGLPVKITDTGSPACLVIVFCP